MKDKKGFLYFQIAIWPILYILIAFLIPTDFAIILPNKTDDVSQVFEIENYEANNNIHSVSVLSMNKIFPFQKIFGRLGNRNDIYKMSVYESELSYNEQRLRGQIQKEASKDQAIISSYTKANLTNPLITINYNFLGMIIDYREAKFNNLLIGDIILDINNQEFDDYYEMGTYFINHNGEFTLKILRDESEIVVNILKGEFDVFRFYPKYTNIITSPLITFNDSVFNSSGPSAGLVYTLSIYYTLLDSNLINEVVVGTGTIRYNNLVGEIGGLRQKVLSSISEGRKYFILPSSQLDEVIDLSNEINLYPVTSLDDAIDVINNIFS